LKKLIFTNGCFDILHKGHISLLEYCKSLGTVIVGLNSDSSVRRLKGSKRPVNNERDRKYFLESLKYVDKVFIFEEDTPYDLITKIKPDIIVKGGDYTVESVIGKELSEVRIFKYVEGYSTTKVIQDIVNR
tara:strand:+ start:870 stop:1262 length:393 start_codon:yes stop_codon:yes gene_type:complete